MEAMEVLGKNFMKASPVTKDEVAKNCMNDNTNDQLNQEAKLDWSTKNLVDEEPDSRSRIEEAEKLIKRIDQRLPEVSWKIRERMSNQKNLISRLKSLNYRDEGFRSTVARKTKQRDSLQLALDKLSFANNAYQDRTINLCLVDDEINCHNLNFQMLHGSKNLATEKELLREVRASKRGEAVGSWSSLEELNNSILGLHWRSLYNFNSHEVKNKQLLLREIKELEIAREKVIANASVKGRIWNSLGSKKALQDQIKLLDKESEKVRKEHLAVRADIKHVKKELLAAEKDINSLLKQTLDLCRQRDEAYQRFPQLRKQQNEILS